MVVEVRPDYDTEWQAMKTVTAKLGIGDGDAAQVGAAGPHRCRGPGTTTEESAQIKAMKKEIAELKRANEILKAAASSFVAELDRPHTRS